MLSKSKLANEIRHADSSQWLFDVNTIFIFFGLLTQIKQLSFILYSQNLATHTSTLKEERLALQEQQVFSQQQNPALECIHRLQFCVKNKQRID